MSLKADFQKKTKQKVADALQLKNLHAVPRIEKIVLNVGIGDFASEKEQFGEIARQLTKITGQKPKLCKAKKAISGFKIRRGMDVALMVTLRGKKMYDFFDRLVNVSLPRIRDFRGVKIKNFDRCANLNLGLREVIIFPEVNFDDLKKSFGLSISIQTSTRDQKKAKILLGHLGMVFEAPNQSHSSGTG